MSIEDKIHLLEAVEFLIPVIFFVLAHFLDNKVHLHWQQWKVHHDKWLVKIFHYQWELCFLVYSLYYVYGVRFFTVGNLGAERDEKMIDGGIWLMVISGIAIFTLVILAFIYTNRNRSKFSAIPMYMAIGGYFFLSIIYLYFHNIIYWNLLIPIICLLFLVVLIIFERSEKYIIPPTPKANSYVHNTYIYWNTPHHLINIRAEAALYICEEATDKKKCIRAKRWLRRFKLLMPDNTRTISRLQNSINAQCTKK